MYLQTNTYFRANIVPSRRNMPIRPVLQPAPASVLSPIELRRIIAEQLG